MAFMAPCAWKAIHKQEVKMKRSFRLSLGAACAVVLVTAAVAEKPPTFSLAWSEYPSWSAFGVAHEYRIIDGRKGKLGPVEEKWGVDIELKEADYDSCIVMYGAAQCDAACLTNMDSLAPSLSRPSVAILPTSTSDGGDACIVTSTIGGLSDLKGRPTYGLAKTVSEYCFARNLELQGANPADFPFSNMDPGAAALAMQQKQDGFDAIVVWNPFVLETLRKRDDTRVLFDSTAIPGEIVDMVTMAADSLNRPKGPEFACAMVETFYVLNEKLADPATRDDALIALGEKFSHLDLASMQKVVQQTKFYASPDAGLALFEGPDLKATMERVVAFCVDKEIVDRAPGLAYGSQGDAALRFDPSFMKKVAGK
jgi:NitT/TauT family transport system substrate-binding protein